MSNEKKLIDEIRQKVMQEVNSKYGSGRSAERIVSIDRYNSLPVTSPQSNDEIALMLEDVVVVMKEKLLRNGDIVSTYEVFDEDLDKILETEDDGKMKFDKEIFDELLKDKLNAIEEAGYEVASMNTMDAQGRVESFFELINGKLSAINKEQKERLERAEDRQEVLSEISSESIEPDIDYSKKSKAVDETKSKKQNEQHKQKDDQVVDDLQSQGIDAVAVTKEIDDAVFESNTGVKGARAALTRDGHIEIVHEANGRLEKAEGFGESTNRTGETFMAWNDEEQIGDQVHTYGEIKKGDMTYSITKDEYGNVELAEKRESREGHNSANEQYFARGVQTKGTAYYKENREGIDNNITNESFDSKRPGSNYVYAGKGGAGEIARSNKKHGGSKDYTMEGFAANDNLRAQEAMRMVDDALKKNGISLDPDAEANLEKRITAYVTNSDHVFCEEDAQAYAMEVQIEMRNASRPSEDIEKSDETDTGRDRLAEAEAKRLAQRGG